MRKIILLLCLLLVESTVFSATASDVLQAKLNAIRTMSATFQQIVKTKNRELTRSSGTMALMRPGRLRWQTKTPMEQLVIADGQRLWIYDVDLEQVTVKKQSNGLGGTAALFLSGYNETVARDFVVTEKSHGKMDSFVLQAKSSKANFQQLKFIFINNALMQMDLFDQLGQHTEVKLSQIKTNRVLAPTLFVFKAPKGVDLVKE